MVVELLLTFAAGLAGGWGLVGLSERRRRDVEGPLQSPPTVAAPDSRFEQLLRSLTVGIITLDGSGRIDSVNAAAATIFEFGSRPVLGRAMIEVVSSYDLDRRVRGARTGPRLLAQPVDEDR